MGDEAVVKLSELLSKHLVKPGPVSKFQLPIFAGNCGKTKQHTPYFEWRYMVKKLQNLNKTDEVVVENAVLNSLTGEARTRYIRLESTGEKCVDILKKFDSIYKDSTDLMQRVQKLHELKQGKGESISEFVDRVETCRFWVTEMDDVSSFYKTDNFLKNKLSESLSDKEIADKLLYMVGDESKSFTDYKNKLIEIEKRSKDALTVKAVQPIMSPENDRITRLEEKFDQLLSTMQSNQASNFDNKNTSNQGFRNQGHFRKPIKCWRCNKIGHTKKDCRVKLASSGGAGN